MSNFINLPRLGFLIGDTVRSRITKEIFSSFADGDDLVLSEQATLNVKEANKALGIRN